MQISTTYLGTVAASNYSLTGRKTQRVAVIPQKEATEKVTLTNMDSLKQIASQYNICSMSPKEMLTMSKKLLDSGSISEDDYISLTLDPFLETSGYNEITGNFDFSTARPDKQRDYIDAWENKLNLQKKYGVPADFVKNTERILNLLKNIDTIGNNSQA